MMPNADTSSERKHDMTNRAALQLANILGLTTGIGIVAWGAWSLIVSIVLTFYERSGISVDQVVIEDAFNQGILQSAMVIALGVVILELRRIRAALAGADDGG